MPHNVLTVSDDQRLFSYLSSYLFRPLSSADRVFYSELLLWLYTDVFSVIGETPSKRATLEQIERFIANQHAKGFFLKEDGSDLAFKRSEKKEKATDRGRIYKRLLQSGWLIEHKSRYRVLIDFDPDARTVLKSLVAISNGETRSYGGAVLNVQANLRDALAHPDTNSESLRNAVHFSHEFLQHLRTVGAAMRKIEQEILKKNDAAYVLKNFFQDFVEKYLIEDYKRLNTKNNPFRFRHSIISLCYATEQDISKILDLAGGYVSEGRAATETEAEEIIRQELVEIRHVFEHLEDTLSIIDETIARLERRVRNMVRYMDRHRSHRSRLTLDALKEVARLPSTASIPPQISPFVPFNFPIGREMLYQRKVQVRPPISRTVTVEKIDLAVRAFEQARRDFFNLTHPSKSDVQNFLLNIFDDRKDILGSEIPINSIGDFIIFERLRVLPSLFGGLLMQTYDFERIPNLIINDWVQCNDFRISIKQVGGDLND